MMRSLWTAASGMSVQQVQVDTISNNLANVNTIGYKQETMNFKSLLYQNLTTSDATDSTATGLPSPMQVGHGVRLGSMTRDFSFGGFLPTGNATDLAIQGAGFFAIMDGNEVSYTKDGSFKFSNVNNEYLVLVTASGDPVLSTEGEPIMLDPGVEAGQIFIDPAGTVAYIDRDLGTQVEVATLQLVQFANVEGLQAIGDNYYRETVASGAALSEIESEGLTRSEIQSGYLEASNVDVATEMVNLIIAQRAYEMNSTAIKTSDEMLQQANGLKRM
ncbi:MAG: hypothetical protein ATN36_01260 [Epulopiscium sp. Nele67-Bin005]|nr:MAG: hypothetical protein ATN36_01260 [Epulopiscium sp. Nele67-Bin005]